VHGGLLTARADTAAVYLTQPRLAREARRQSAGVDLVGRPQAAPAVVRLDGPGAAGDTARGPLLAGRRAGRHNDHMRATTVVGARELKTRLGRYLNRVRRGDARG
jgi:hypothetical protein